MAKVYVLMKDERDYNGELIVFAVFTSEAMAEATALWEREKEQDWIDSMRESGDKVGDWVPSFWVTEVDLIEGEK